MAAPDAEVLEVTHGDELVELEGYLTAVRSAAGAPAVYLHATSGRTLRVELSVAAREGGLPMGPEHPVRVWGRVQADPLLPTLRAERIDELRSHCSGDVE